MNEDFARRAHEYEAAALALRQLADIYQDVQVKATLETQASELDETAKRWRMACET